LAPLLTYPLYSKTDSTSGIAPFSTETHTMRQVAFHRPSIGPDEEREVLDTLRSGWITTGPKAKRFEHEFAGYVGAKHALAVSHCTGALRRAGLRHGSDPQNRAQLQFESCRGCRARGRLRAPHGRARDGEGRHHRRPHLFQFLRD